MAYLSDKKPMSAKDFFSVITQLAKEGKWGLIKKAVEKRKNWYKQHTS